METVHVGWLIKSPPEKPLWRAKWRRRWFVLRQSGQIPGQYLLEYYTDTTLKKLKGKIDLDQCNQVDAGLTFESRKWNYQFMFDIQTPKRIYFLVAETELEMNNWVECICSVCGLKMDAEESNQIEEPTIQLTVMSQPQPSPISEINSCQEEPSGDEPDSPSGPYIPISQCVSGKPTILNGIRDFLEEAPPPPPQKGSTDTRLSGESYDYPRPIHPPGLDDSRSSPDSNIEDLYKIPPLRAPPNQSSNLEDNWSLYSMPKVNWDTYPHEGETLVRRVERVYINPEFRGRKKSQEIYENVLLHQESLSDSESHDGSVKTIPPRPPKPAHLSDTTVTQTNYQNVTTKVIPPPKLNLNSISASYDIPPPTSGIVIDKLNVTEYSKSPLSNSYQQCLDEMYDFPRPIQDDTLNAMPPAPSNTLTQQRRHQYSNAPAGYMQDNVFTYDARAYGGENYLSMDSQKVKSPDLYTDMSGESRSPVAVYTNLPSPLASIMPPVHRDLKPKRKTSDGGVVALSRSCSSASSTDVSAKSPSPVENLVPPSVNRELKPKRSVEDVNAGNKQNSITLAPPPVCRIKSSNTKRSFRKPRASPSPTTINHVNKTPVALPNNTINNKIRSHSSSDDEHSSSGGSRRNSTNDDQQSHCFFSFTSLSSRREPEIQYLDLDLDSDLTQSPKSPERASTSTVYKTVDFVKTKAFNETRQNVEETYRKSQ